MATYLVEYFTVAEERLILTVEAKSQRDAAEHLMVGPVSEGEEVTVYTLAKGSPVSTFRRRTETVTVLERVSE